LIRQIEAEIAVHKRNAKCGFTLWQEEVVLLIGELGVWSALIY